MQVTFRAFLWRPTDVLAPASEWMPSVTGACPLYGNKCDIAAGICSLYGHVESITSDIQCFPLTSLLVCRGGMHILTEK